MTAFLFFLIPVSIIIWISFFAIVFISFFCYNTVKAAIEVNFLIIILAFLLTMIIEDFTLDYDFGLVILASIMFAYTILNPEANERAATLGTFACIPLKLLRIDKSAIIPKVHHNVRLIIIIDLVILIFTVVKVDLRLILKSRLIIQTLFIIALLSDSFNNF